MSQWFGYPEVGRFGLAHSLLAWARCEVWCADHGHRMIAPSWFHLRIGPYLRGERDKRAYHRLFRFPGYITGPRRQWLLLTKQKIEVRELPDTLAQSQQGGVVVFRNLISNNEETHFHEILGRHEQVSSALWKMTKPPFQPERTASPHIAIHVRRGDFGQGIDFQALRAGHKNAQLPIAWYRDMLDGVLAQIGPVPVRVFSDGSDEELRPLLAATDVVRMPGRSAITDLLAMSQAKLIISSGSGFSMWGSYLGHVPRICFPGQRFVRALGGPRDVDLEPECEYPRELPAPFIERVGCRFGR
jgi:hypothetical protein